MITFRQWEENEYIFAILDNETYLGRIMITPDEVRFNNVVFFDSSKYFSPDTLVKIGIALNNKFGYKEFVIGAEK